MRLFLLLLCVCCVGHIQAEQDFCQRQALGNPDDVRAFIEGRCYCNHFSGEDAYDEARRRFLEKMQLKYCGNADKDFDRLQLKYAGQPEIIAKFAEYENEVKGSRAAAVPLSEADGRDSKATRKCATREIEAAQKTVANANTKWSEASWVAAQRLFECADATFVREKTLVSESGETYRDLQYVFKDLGIGIQYSYGRTIALVTDCDIPKKTEVSAVALDECVRLQKQVWEIINQSRVCTADSECTLVEAACGCKFAVSVSGLAGAVGTAIQARDTACEKDPAAQNCEFKCTRGSRSRCKAGKCEKYEG